jgi:predicted RNA-binding Zn-ribbon protein involved in translation (DUF1610 family)
MEDIDTGEWTKIVSDFLTHGNISKLYICPDCQQNHLDIKAILLTNQVVFKCPSCFMQVTMEEAKET